MDAFREDGCSVISMALEWFNKVEIWVSRYSCVDEMHDAVYYCLIHRGEACYRRVQYLNEIGI